MKETKAGREGCYGRKNDGEDDGGSNNDKEGQKETGVGWNIDLFRRGQFFLTRAECEFLDTTIYIIKYPFYY